MRVRVLALAIASLLAPGLAAAQIEVPKVLEVPGDMGANRQSTGSNEAGSRHARYLMRIETLRERVVRTQARDGGQLTPDHAANLQHELDKLNRVYGVKPG